MTISLIVNANMTVETTLHILQQGPNESTLNSETCDQAIMNISKDIDATTKKFGTQKRKKLEAKPKKMNADVKVARKKIMKKRTPMVESFSSSNNEISLPPLK